MPRARQGQAQGRVAARHPRGGSRRRRTGAPVVVPGKPDESEIVARLVSDDPDERMPPPGSGRSLTKAQIDVIRRWVVEGAEFKGHWAYLPPVRPQVPDVSAAGFVRNDVDRFILAKLAEKGLKPSPEADRVTLIRRLSFDLRGLPPTPAEVDAFVNDRAPDAYESLVDRVLASPQYGERMATLWLDLVRYADTTATTATTTATSPSTATTSSTPSTATCPSTASPSSSSPATSCPMPARGSGSRRGITGR